MACKHEIVRGFHFWVCGGYNTIYLKCKSQKSRRYFRAEEELPVSSLAAMKKQSRRICEERAVTPPTEELLTRRWGSVCSGVKLPKFKPCLWVAWPFRASVAPCVTRASCLGMVHFLQSEHNAGHVDLTALVSLGPDLWALWTWWRLFFHLRRPLTFATLCLSWTSHFNLSGLNGSLVEWNDGAVWSFPLKRNPNHKSKVKSCSLHGWPRGMSEAKGRRPSGHPHCAKCLAFPLLPLTA